MKLIRISKVKVKVCTSENFATEKGVGGRVRTALHLAEVRIGFFHNK